MNNEKFEIDAEGAPTITVSGNTKVVDIDTSGAGEIDTNNLRASRAVVESKGASKVELDVSDQLDVTVSGPSISDLQRRSGSKQEPSMARARLRAAAAKARNAKQNMLTDYGFQNAGLT